jgi:hypothetical protein
MNIFLVRRRRRRSATGNICRKLVEIIHNLFAYRYGQNALHDIPSNNRRGGEVKLTEPLL